MLLRLDLNALLLIGISVVVFPQLALATTTFNLWAYGSDGTIGGVPVYYQDGLAILSNSTSNSALTPVYFSQSSNAAGTWTVYPNTTVSSNASFTEAQLTLPNSNATTRQVGIVNGTSSTQTTADFFLYGGTVFAVEDGEYETLFYATPSNTSGTWTLLWDPSDTNDSGLVPVALRDVAPN